jgi:hypothetical protein
MAEGARRLELAGRRCSLASSRLLHALAVQAARVSAQLWAQLAGCSRLTSSVCCCAAQRQCDPAALLGGERHIGLDRQPLPGVRLVQPRQRQCGAGVRVQRIVSAQRLRCRCESKARAARRRPRRIALPATVVRPSASRCACTCAERAVFAAAGLASHRVHSHQARRLGRHPLGPR